MDDADRERARGRIFVLAAGAAFSVGGPLVRLLEEATPWQFLLYRSGAVAVAAAAYLALRGTLLGSVRAAGLDAVVGGIGLGTAFAGFIFSVTHTTVANTLILLSTAPLWTALLGWVVLRERVRGTAWLAIGGGFAGIAIMASDNVALGTFGATFADGAALAAALGFATFSVAIRRGRARDMAPAILFAGLLTAAVAGLAVVLGGESLRLGAHDATIAVGYGVIALGAGFGLYTIGSRSIPAVELTVLSMSEVVLGPLWVWLAFDETPAGLTLLGGAVILAAVLVLAVAGSRER